METIYLQTIKHILTLEKTKGEDEVSNGTYHQSMYIISLFIDLKNIHFDYQSEKGNNLIDTCTKQTFLKLADSYTKQQLEIKEVQILLYNEALIFALETILEFHGSKPKSQKKLIENTIYKTTDISTLATLKQELKRELIRSTGNADNDFVQHLDNRIEYIKEVGSTPHQLKEIKTPQQKEKKYTGKDYALSYIFDLYVDGKQLPINIKEGGFQKSEIMKIGEDKYSLNGDTFYRAILEVNKYNLNSARDLKQISTEWENVLCNLSTDWAKTKKYLKEKKLIK